MEKIDDILLEGKELFQSLGRADLMVRTMAMYHSTQIKLRLTGDTPGATYTVTCDHCKYFKGDLSTWAAADLRLDYIKENLRFGQREMENYLFELTDLNSGYLIRCKNISFQKEPAEETGQATNYSTSFTGLENNYPETNAGDLNAILQKYPAARARIINSDKDIINIRLDGNTEQRLLDAAKQSGDWYTLDTAYFVDIFCYEPSFVQVNFLGWETNAALQINKENDDVVISGEGSSFRVQCAYIKVTSEPV